MARMSNQFERTDMSNVCCTCNSEELPLAEDANDEDDEQTIESVAYDSCAEWHHIACVEIESIFFVPPANNLYSINGHRHSVG